MVGRLPTDAVADLISVGVCPRCIFRFFGIRDAVYSSPVLTCSLISCKCTCAHEPSAATEQSIGPNHSIGSESGEKSHPDFSFGGMSDPCIVCLGILHTLDATVEGIPDVDGGKSKSFSTQEQILLAIKEEGHQFGSFCVETTLPAVILVRERALWEYLQKKYGSESWLHGRQANEHVVSLKEVLKWSLIEPLERILEARYDIESFFRVVLVYKHHEASSELDFLKCATTVSTKRKLAAEGTMSEPGESLAAVQRSLVSMPSEIFVDQYSCPPSKLTEFCQLTVLCYRTSTYVGGRYLKLSRNISQSRWLIDDERMGDGSVQEIIADIVFPLFKADSYKFHAAGREDIDVRMLGSGRPFMLELSNARNLLSNEELADLQDRINNSKEGWVKVRNLKLVGSGSWNLMLEGEAEKQKQYMAVVWLSRSIMDADVQHLSDLKNLEIQQKTPVRVLHRRSPLVRSRTIHWMRCERISGTQQYFFLHLCTQAGTYIKEFVHGDLGRTYPNIGSLLGCEAEILQLDVTDIKMDLFD